MAWWTSKRFVQENGPRSKLAMHKLSGYITSTFIDFFLKLVNCNIHYDLYIMLQAFYTLMTEEYGIPEWGCYVIFALLTIVTGLLLGLVSYLSMQYTNDLMCFVQLSCIWFHMQCLNIISFSQCIKSGNMSPVAFSLKAIDLWALKVLKPQASGNFSLKTISQWVF